MMKKLMLAVSGAVAVAASSIAPVNAAPWRPDGLSVPAPQVEQVQYRPRPGPVYRHHYAPARGYYHRGGRYYYNGHRGYNYYRPGYRQYNGWWFPAAAFATGALIGGAIAAQPSAPRYAAPAAGNAHVQWCMSQYRSYRVSDNSFQPYNGPRQQCVSPY